MVDLQRYQFKVFCTACSRVIAYRTARSRLGRNIDNRTMLCVSCKADLLEAERHRKALERQMAMSLGDNTGLDLITP